MAEGAAERAAPRAAPLPLLGDAERVAARLALLTTEQGVWCELIRCLSLTRQLRRMRDESTAGQATPNEAAEEEDAATAAKATAAALPLQILLLQPPAPQEGWPMGMPAAPPEMAFGRYPPVRRAQRLSYLIASLLPDLDRQRLLTCGTASERLGSILTHLTATRSRLAAVASLRKLS